jgi:hypothetical protein
MEKSFVVQTARRSTLSCVWIETGNPARPLACTWISRDQRAIGDCEERANEPNRLCA